MMTSNVLVIEDEPAVADTLTYALATEGFNPTWCRTAQEGLDALHTTSFALIILDIGLPDRSGFDLCRTIRTTYEHLPIMFLTARAEEIDRILGLELGADDYVTKPFSPREVTARVKAILRRTTPPTTTETPEATPPHGFTIHPENYRITWRNTPLELTRYEFLLLQTLLRRPNRIFDREQLMNQAWDDPLASTPRTVDTHIKSIRAKLRAIDPQTDPIVTHRGLGYSLKAE